jgi:hypothetical protein
VNGKQDVGRGFAWLYDYDAGTSRVSSVVLSACAAGDRQRARVTVKESRSTGLAVGDGRRTGKYIAASRWGERLELLRVCLVAQVLDAAVDVAPSRLKVRLVNVRKREGRNAMPSTRKSNARVVVDTPEIEIRQLDMDGYTVTFNAFKVASDLAPLFRGLPNDTCQCPHWGMVLRGKLVYRFADHEETYTAGDANYVGPEHRRGAERGLSDPERLDPDG